MKHNQNGFTLVELIVSIAVGSLVTLAATTVLLLGLRINNRSTQTVVRQNNARVVITMLENLASEGEITAVQTEEDGSWTISNADDVILASYDSQTKAIYPSRPRPSADEATSIVLTPLLEDVSESKISLDQKGLLSISLIIDEIPYGSSVFCRTMRKPIAAEEETIVDSIDDNLESITEGRKEFLNVLLSQYEFVGGSPNPGLILDGQYSTGIYYSQWYLGGSYEGHDGWNAETPWCACFISWGLCYTGKDTNNDGINENNVAKYVVNGSDGSVAFANVDSFWEYFNSLGAGHVLASGATPTPGDIIFIDWNKGSDPAHVGAVLAVQDGYVFTIEGNRDNRVMVCKYALNNPIIMGYGVIDWDDGQSTSQGATTE